MKKLVSTFCLIMLLVTVFGSAFGCKSTDKTDNELKTYFTSMYDAFNSNDYAGYLSYYNFTDEEIAEQVAFYETMSSQFTSKYTVESVKSSVRSDGAYAVTVTYIIESTNLSDSSVTTLRSTVFYLMERNNGSWSISDYANGEVENILPGATGAVDYVTHDNHFED